MIRLATQGDLPAIVALTAVAYARYGAVLDAPPLPVTEDYAPRIAAGQVWVAEGPAGAPSGLIVLEHEPDHLLIFSVAVAPERQGEGLGRRLLAWAEAEARAAGVDTLRLYTNARMTRNIALYTRCGYRETGRRAHPIRPGWVLVDMEKSLQVPLP